jgi:hypothetical protein
VKPRYKPTWLDTSTDEELIGYVGPLDIYYEHSEDNEEDWLLVVGPEERMVNGANTHNFDVYVIKDRSRLEPHFEEKTDIHIELAEMCEIYALAIRLGYLEAVDGAEI